MKYEKITINIFNDIQEHIVIDNGDGSFKSFPVDETNPEYLLFLQEIEGEK